MVRMDLGDLLLTRGDLEQAEPFHRDLLVDFERAFGPDSFYTWRARFCIVQTLNLMAESDSKQGARAYAEAKAMMAEARRRLPDGHSFRRGLMFTAWAMQVAWKEDEAEQLLHELDVLNRANPIDGEQRYLEGTVNFFRGRLALHGGRLEVAKSYFSQAAKTWDGVLRDDNPDLVECRAKIRLLSDRGSTNVGGEHKGFQPRKS
jgi:hypothetical protein